MTLRRAAPSAQAPKGTSARESVLRHALFECLKGGLDDGALLKAIGTLWESEARAGGFSIQPTRLLASAAGDSLLRSKGASFPPLADFLFWCTQKDALGCRHESIVEIDEAARSGRLIPPEGAAHVALAIARSPWAASAGLMLNEAKPETAALWPHLCAMASPGSKELPAIAKAAGPFDANLASDRDALISIACRAHNKGLLSMALAALPSAPPSAERIADYAKALFDQTHPSPCLQTLGIATAERASKPEMASMIAEAFPSCAAELLAGLCHSEMALPEQLDAAMWGPTRAKLAKHGASELTLASLETIAERAILLAGVYAHNPGYPTAPRNQRVGARDMGEKDFDALAGACVKKMLIPRSVVLAPDAPPLAFRLLVLLPQAGPSARAAIVLAMNAWSKNGFGRDALAWTRSSAGHTQSIGTAIAALPMQKDPAKNFQCEMERWLTAAIEQGLDIEARTSPKSKTLGDKLRTNAAMRSFWPLVEAHLLRGAAPASTAAPRPSKSL